MSNVTLIGIDLAKSVFQVCGVDAELRVVFNRQIRRSQLGAFIARYPAVRLVMEACSGSNYWGRYFESHGHPVELIAPQHVKPYVSGNKTDRNDALAICEASRRPRIQRVRPRSVAQTECMMLHRVRQRRVRERTRLVNQLRGLLNEYGIVVRRGHAPLRQALDEVLADAGNELTPSARELVVSLQQEWQALDARVQAVDIQLRALARDEALPRRLRQVHGVGDLVSTAAWAVLGDGRAYRSGRHFAANLGLVPREHSSGGQQRFGAITKRGNSYLRYLLVQAGHNIVRYAPRRAQDRLSRWALELATRRGHHKAVVAVANKLARILWAMAVHQRTYHASGWAQQRA